MKVGTILCTTWCGLTYDLAEGPTLLTDAACQCQCVGKQGDGKMSSERDSKPAQVVDSQKHTGTDRVQSSLAHH